MKISLLNIVEDTTVDGPGFRTAVYCAGCVNHCPGCHNPQSWDIRNGSEVEASAIFQQIMSDEFANVTFTGGDPMYQAKGFTELARLIKENSTKTIWCYTGYLFEDLLQMPDTAALLHYIDVLVDGLFMEALKDEDLLFRGSSNQRLVDVQASLRSGKTELLDYRPFLSEDL